MTASRKEEEAKDLERKSKIITSWMEEKLKAPLPSNDLRESLIDGVVLCKLANVLKPGCIRKFHRQPRMLMMKMENIAFFLTACQSRFSVPQATLFAPTDIHDDSDPGGANMLKVVRVLLMLAHEFPGSTTVDVEDFNAPVGVEMDDIDEPTVEALDDPAPAPTPAPAPSTAASVDSSASAAAAAAAAAVAAKAAAEAAALQAAALAAAAEAEAARFAAELEQAKLRAEKEAADKAAAAERERLAAVERERIAAERAAAAERDRIAAERDRIAAAERDRIAAEKAAAAERERLTAERAAAERERITAERVAAEKAKLAAASAAPVTAASRPAAKNGDHDVQSEILQEITHAIHYELTFESKLELISELQEHIRGLTTKLMTATESELRQLCHTGGMGKTLSEIPANKPRQFYVDWLLKNSRLEQ
jgi:chemotaxis protein histidine kinase CheA